jgi:hypothetical protein
MNSRSATRPFQRRTGKAWWKRSTTYIWVLVSLFPVWSRAIQRAGVLKRVCSAQEDQRDGVAVNDSPQDQQVEWGVAVLPGAGRRAQARPFCPRKCDRDS